MTRSDPDHVVDLLVVGAGPTGIAIGAEARKAGLSALLVERGPLVASLVDYPNDMLFFTTRDRLEIADLPFAIPDEKPTRRQAIAYYQAVAAHYRLDLALHEETEAIAPLPAAEGGGFRVRGRCRSGTTDRRARAVAIATGYFAWPKTLGVPGEERPWVHRRYREPWRHWNESVVVVGGGNSAAETALDLWRHGARVTIVHHRPELKPTIKYWVKPDLENRIEEGSIAARLDAHVCAFVDAGVEIERQGRREVLPADACYVLIGYRPSTRLYETAGVRFDPETLVQEYDEASCESNVPGLYVAGTIQAGRETHQIFIENSRDHGPRIVAHLLGRLGQPAGTGAVSSAREG